MRIYNDTTLHSLFNQCSIDGEAGFNATYWNNREYKGKIAATDRLTTPFHFSAEGSTVFAPGVGIEKFHRHLSFHFPPNRFRCRHFPRDD